MPDLGRAISDTCFGEKEKCEGVGRGLGVMPKTFSRLLFLSISELTLLI